MIEYGISPNKVVVSGVNILIFTHLIVILIAYSKYIKTESGITKIMTKLIVSFYQFILFGLYLLLQFCRLFSILNKKMGSSHETVRKKI